MELQQNKEEVDGVLGKGLLEDCKFEFLEEDTGLNVHKARVLSRIQQMLLKHLGQVSPHATLRADQFIVIANAYGSMEQALQAIDLVEELIRETPDNVISDDALQILEEVQNLQNQTGQVRTTD